MIALQDDVSKICAGDQMYDSLLIISTLLVSCPWWNSHWVGQPLQIPPGVWISDDLTWRKSNSCVAKPDVFMWLHVSYPFLHFVSKVLSISSKFFQSWTNLHRTGDPQRAGYSSWSSGVCMFVLQELLCAPPAWRSFTTVLLLVMMYSGRSKLCTCGLGPSPEKNWLLHGLGAAVCREDGYSCSWKETPQALCSQRQLPPLSSRRSYFKLLYTFKFLFDIVLLISSLTANLSSAFCQVCFSSVEQSLPKDWVWD